MASSAIEAKALAKAETFIPRSYQEEIFAKAKESNIIAALDTGSGKTYISTMLIKWATSREAARGKLVVFLVPKVPLVDQQANFIADQTPLRVCKLHGIIGVDMTDRAGWRKKFKRYDVFVLTAQIFLNLLTHSHCRMSQVCLMIFDECHHARKNHPYNGIMREYFRAPSNARPKIFGMTASPIWNPRDATGSLTTLEQSLDAKVIGVRLHKEELDSHAPKPLEVVKLFPPPPREYPYPSPSLMDCLDVFRSWISVHIPWMKIQMRYVVTQSELGPYAGELYLFIVMQHLINQFSAETEDDQLYIDAQPQLPWGSEGDLPQARAILDDFSPFFEGSPGLGESHMTVLPEWYSPKVHALAEILLEHYTPTFQGIVFVEQRQIAICLARLLPLLPSLKGVIRCADLVGQGGPPDTLRAMGTQSQAAIVRSFREKHINLLIATSVAEEGLDFPACDIVVRFDQLQHLVGYVQSRGRARNAASKFVVMIQKDDSVYLARYRSFSESEPHLRRTYQTRASLRLPVAPEEEEGEESETHPRDLADRERYVIKSTGAVLTYDTSISLLNYLCSLIPADPYTPLPMPKYGGDFQATLHLPHGLPLSQKDLVFSGPVKRTKKEAKRAVAFVAVRRMHELAVFDDYLLPAFGSDVDTDGTYSPDFNRVPEHMDVLVRDPWTTGGQLWLHVLHVDGCPTAGLITSSILPDIELVSEGHVYKTTRASRVCCGEDQIELLESFTMHGIMLCNTGRLFTPPLSCFLVPITNSLEPDFEFIDYLAGRFHGSNNWSRIGDDAYHQLILINVYEGGRTFLLQRIRHDLTPASKPPEGSLEAQFETYRDYFVDRYSRKRRPDFHPHVAIDEPLLEVLRLPKCVDGAYDLAATTPTHPVEAPPTVMNGGLLPRNCCRWLSFPLELYRAFYILPKLCRRITDVFRARQARFELGLPPIIENFLVEALMLPPSLAQWNNQRLETLGDSVLKLANTVHLFNCFPHRHEGQLSRMRHLDVSNKSLMTCAKVIGLERFLTCETQAISKWRYVESREQSLAIPATRFAQRRFPRRNLQDCMEAILGAAFLTGGIPMALYAGEALTMNLGGRIAWPQRYQRQSIGDDIPSLFTELQDNLGYRFRQLSLLTEAVTHPSFSDVTDTTSYQRLEFLGDAVIDLVVMNYLFNKFPGATSHQLSRPRSRAVCSAGLAAIAIKRLGIHKVILTNSTELSKAISRFVPILEAVSVDEILNEGWKFDPPKAISDVFEGVVGALLIDSGYDYDLVASVVENVMEDVLGGLSPRLRPDPTSELTEWMGKSGCRAFTFRGLTSHGRYSIEVVVHDVLIAGPISNLSKPLARSLVSERALLALRDECSDKYLMRICDCGDVKTEGLDDTEIESVDENTIANTEDSIL